MDSALLASLNSQINFERYSAEVYLALAVPLDDIDLSGMGNWLYTQAHEERKHAQKFIDYLLDVNETVDIDALAKPEVVVGEDVFGLVRKTFIAALEHENKVTERIHALYKEAQAVADLSTCEFLRWFVTEQVEEERKIVLILNRLNIAGNDGAALLILDKELGGG
jgi:ferritin